MRECLSVATAVDRSTVGVSAELHISPRNLRLPPPPNRRRDLCSGQVNGSNKYENTQYNPANIAPMLFWLLHMRNSRGRKESAQMQISRTVTYIVSHKRAYVSHVGKDTAALIQLKHYD